MIPKAERRQSPLRPGNIRHTVGDVDSPLTWQRSSDIYVAVVRLPDPPHLRLAGSNVELIPGENHWETLGYDLFRNGKKITEQPLQVGETIRLPETGRLTAVAIERSGLKSRPSLPVELGRSVTLNVLAETPADFSWTSDRFRVGARKIPAADANKVPEAIREIVHLHDGLIHREWLQRGRLVRRDDLNPEGKTIRRLLYENGKLTRREYYDDAGDLVSTELFDAAGYITEAIRDGGEHWWYRRGVPWKYVRRSEGFRKEGDRWVEFDP